MQDSKHRAITQTINMNLIWWVYSVTQAVNKLDIKVKTNLMTPAGKEGIQFRQNFVGSLDHEIVPVELS